MNIDTSKLDSATAQDIKEILDKYNSDLEEYGLSEENDDLETVIALRCSLTTKSLFALNKLISHLPNGEIRPQQVILLARISNAMEKGQDGLMQAGTGVGKSIAYLIPTIISGRKCFVSTSTKQLTSQLTEKDLPLLKKYLFPKLNFAALQSLSNYLCLRRYKEIADEISISENIFKTSRNEDFNAFKKITPYLEKYRNGEIEAENFTIDNLGCVYDSFQCAGSSCVRACKFEGKPQCPVFQIFTKVMKSDVVVTNHAYISRMLVNASKDETKKLGMLKDRNLWICDEAHDLEGYLERAFSATLSLPILKNVYIPKLMKYLETTTMGNSFSKKFEKYDEIIHKDFPDISPKDRYFTSDELMDDVKIVGQTFGSIIQIMEKYMYDAENLLEMENQDSRVRKESIENEVTFDEKDMERFKEFIDTLTHIKEKLETLSGVEVKNVPTTKNMINEVLESIKTFYLAFVDNESYVTYYNYINAKGDGHPQFTMSSTYLKSGDALQASLGYLDLDKSDLKKVNKYKVNLIGVSATLCIEGSFKDMADRLGMLKLKDIHCLCTDVGTVFDYKKQGLMYVPQGIPDVKNNRKEHFDFFKCSVKKLIEASNGGALILCTTKRETQETYKYLSYEFAGKFNVLSAEDDKWKNKNDLVKEFRNDVNSVLVGTRGFFQGLDVQGESLRLLCLNKLPFESPGVVTKRKSKIAESKGLNAYRTTAIVPTTMLLLQALGRLIRHTTDKGAVAIFDDRLYTGASWLASIIHSIPPFEAVDSIEDVEEFFRNNV